MNTNTKDIISNSLQSIRMSKGLEVPTMADFLGIPLGTFETYLYARNIPSLSTVIRICNYFKWSINSFLGYKDIDDTEQKAIAEINNSLQALSEWKRQHMVRAIMPMMEGMQDGIPHLKNAGLGQRVRILREDSCTPRDKIIMSCKISDSSLRGIESCQRLPSVATFLGLCDILRVSPEYMLCSQITYPIDFCFDFYSLTPRQLSATAKSVRMLITIF